MYSTEQHRLGFTPACPDQGMGLDMLYESDSFSSIFLSLFFFFSFCCSGDTGRLSFQSEGAKGSSATYKGGGIIRSLL